MNAKERIVAAGFVYPAHWDEMGSSEKDLWEDNILGYLDRTEERPSTPPTHPGTSSPS